MDSSRTPVLPPPPAASSLNPDSTSLYVTSNKIMVVAVLVLFLVVLLMLFLYAYAKWFWRSSSVMSVGRPASWRRRRRFEFAGGEGHWRATSAGLEKSAIDSLPTFVYKVPQPGGDGALECAVCLCEFQENEQGRSLPNCNHSFHMECIDMWLYNHSSCPLCRVSARPDRLPVATEQNSEIPHEIEAPQSPSESIQEEQDRLYPANVLFWGDGIHISSRTSSPRLERNRGSTRVLPDITIDIPRRSDSCLNTPRSSTLGGPSRRQNLFLLRCSSVEEQSCSSDAQVLKSPAAHIKSFKRFVGNENPFTRES